MFPRSWLHLTCIDLAWPSLIVFLLLQWLSAVHTLWRDFFRFEMQRCLCSKCWCSLRCFCKVTSFFVLLDVYTFIPICELPFWFISWNVKWESIYISHFIILFQCFIFCSCCKFMFIFQYPEHCTLFLHNLLL